MAQYIRATLLLGALSVAQAKTYGYISEVDNYSLLVSSIPMSFKQIPCVANRYLVLGSLRCQCHHLQLRPTDILDKLRR